ncbi:MAG: sulfatase-like hydrolase/transferase [Planctomycetota bacterium]
MMYRLLFRVTWIVGLMASTLASQDSLAAEAKPNVVLFLIDDLGWADLGCYGSKFHKTPNLDRLASEGMRFTQAYAACPVCSPTRTAILTGRYPQRSGITTWLPGAPKRPAHRLVAPEVPLKLPVSEVTIAEALKPAGYASASIGKWHLGGAGSLPTDHGFDINIAGDDAGSPYSYFAPYVAGGNAKKSGKTIPGLEQAPADEYLPDRLAAEAEKFIDNHKEQPFFLYMPHFAVHTTQKAKAETIAKYGAMPKDPNGSQQNPIYAAMMESMDEAVGRVLKRLDEHKLGERTLVLFTSDNGGLCNGNGQIIAPTSNAPLRDGKSHLYEGGLRVPLIIRWPGVVKPGSTSEEIVCSIDLFPTILAATASAERKSESSNSALRAPSSALPLDGLDLRPVLDGSGKLTRDAIYWHFPHYNGNAAAKPGAAIRLGDWKLIEFYETGRRELFNLAKDLRESNNLIEQNTEIANDLHAKLAAWRESVGAKMPTPNPDYAPNLQADDGSVMMHSSTADVFGTMLRYEPLPNKDTLGFWVRPEDWARFEFTITKPGRFRLVPHVGCGTNGGSLVHFEVAGPDKESVQTLPLTVPATGGFQKFVPQDLGEVTLVKPGRYTLSIKPQKKEGVAVMDVRRVELRPVTVAQMLPDLKLLEPFWRSATVHRESVLCVKEAADRPADGRLLFPATKIVSVHAANGQKQFELGRDFTLSDDGSRLVLTEQSAIPFLRQDELFPPKDKLPLWKGGAAEGPQSLAHKTGDPETHVLFNNGHWFHDQQIEVTYQRAASDWPGEIPQFAAARLPKTLAKLKAKQKLTIGVSGDSITFGLNASGLVGAPPFMPIYPELVAGQLRATYGGEVALFNRAIGGWNINSGLKDLDQLIAHQPDLVIVAYGMNDVGYRNPEAYRAGVAKLIERLRAANPDVEVILVATMLGNDQWHHTPREMFPKYLDALKLLAGAEGTATNGIALADLTSLWTEMLKRKRDSDLTGNGVNHPSDFGHRVYASAILALLVEVTRPML